jgi:alpha-beta hydrolase superfamily lysophospholipase
VFTFASSADGMTIHVHQWAPSAAPRGVVQLAHGMGEHAARYAHLAETLARAGFAVYANDHRGHGHSIDGTPGDLGPGGWNGLVSDMVQLSGILTERHPRLPLVLVGHSLGSFASQQYILSHSAGLAGVALSGTTALDALLAHMSGDDSGGSVLAAFNKPFEPARTDFDWLSRDEAQVDAYIADAWCGFDLAPQALGELFDAAAGWADSSAVQAGLPVYIFVGEHDPINGGLAFSDVLAERYRRSGQAVTLQDLPRGAARDPQRDQPRRGGSRPAGVDQRYRVGRECGRRS